MAVQVGADKDGLARQRAQYPSVTVFGWQQLHKIAHRGVIRRTTVAIGRCAAARKAFALRRDHFIPFPVHCGHARGNALFRLAVFFFFITQFFQINQSAFSPCSSCFWGKFARKKDTPFCGCVFIYAGHAEKGAFLRHGLLFRRSSYAVLRERHLINLHIEHPLSKLQIAIHGLTISQTFPCCKLFHRKQRGISLRTRMGLTSMRAIAPPSNDAPVRSSSI